MATTKKTDADILTTKMICAATGVTEMTVFNWRQGITRSKLACRTAKAGTRQRITFKRDVFLKWAEKNEVGVDLKALQVSANA